jgi:electron transport complex protein RnfG
MKNYIKSVVTLTLICAVIAVSMAGVNYITAPYIKAAEDKAAQAALLEVMPEGKDFEKLDISSFKLPSTVNEAYKEASGGYVFKLTTTGYSSGFVIMCGVNADGTVSGSLCIASGETLGYEKTFGKNFVGLNATEVESVDTISSATKTTAAYKAAIKDSLNAFAVLNGENVDVRTEEEIFNDNLHAALSLSDKTEFSRVLITELLNDTSAIYSCEHGYVLIRGESFIGVNNDGTVVSDVSDAEKEVVLAQIELIKKEAALLDVGGLPESIKQVKKTLSGNYIFTVHAKGYGIIGKHPSGEPIIIDISIAADGKIIDCLTVSEGETANLGAACADPDFYTQFKGKTESNYSDIDAISGATVTTNAYKNAVADAFSAFKTIKGGSN